MLEPKTQMLGTIEPLLFVHQFQIFKIADI